MTPPPRGGARWGPWAHLPQAAQTLVPHGRDPGRERAQRVAVVVAFIHIAHFRELLRHFDILGMLPDLLYTAVHIGILCALDGFFF